MKIGKISLIIIVFMSLFFTEIAFAEQDKYNPLLKGISFRSISEEKEIVSIFMNGFFEPEVLVEEGKAPKILCDFNHMVVVPGVRHSICTRGKYIRAIRLSMHYSPIPKVRVVIMLSPEEDYLVRQVYEQENTMYVLEVQRKRR